MNLILTCPLGLESLAKKEIELLELPILHSQDKQITTVYSDENVAKLNLWSRVGNKVYLELERKDKIDNFDKLFDLVKKIKWKDLVLEDNPIIVNATSINSKLESLPAIQKTAKKAIVDSLSSSSDKKEGRSFSEFFLRENDKFPTIYIEIVLIKDTCQILIDTTGEALHKRGYRRQSAEAPIRENLAAGLILLSSWRFFENFYDMFCGSGTIAIEAALIAKNIAPGLQRNFAFEKFKFFKPGILEIEKEKAKEKIMNKSYTIIASDIDENTLEIAKNNAENAGVGDIIKFEIKDFRDYLNPPPARGELEGGLKGTFVSNPPYGLRLQDTDLDKLYKDIASIFTKNKELKGGIITNYQFGDLLKFDYKKRKLYNGGEMCYFYSKINQNNLKK